MTMQTIEATEVNVYERRAANGRVHYQYDFKVTMPDGQIYRERRKARGATSPSAARQIGVRRLHDVLRKGPSSRREAEKMPTVEEFAPLWIEYSKAQRHKPSTLHNKALLLRCHILPLIGKLRLNEITEAALALVVKKRADLEPGSVNNLLKYIIALLRCAKEKHGKKIEIPKAPYLTNETEAAWYTAEQFEALVESAATFATADLVLILLAGEAGLRSGEISALRWTDVDLAKREVTIRSNLVRGHEGTPKGGVTRTVPMSGRLHRALVRHQAAEGSTGRVLRRDDGSDMTTDSQRTVLRRVSTYAGLPAYGMHALRHCFGSRMMNGGAGGKVVMRLLGHKKLSTTERYVHASDEHCRSVVDRLLPG